ncbi:MAG TPA: FtsX-like permease family protein [Bryobacteraceae bacterium]|jgi:ABC-type antimicrobial peptide transport system permease subunit|nr:FtsX-like permease family protein [Bryobacteraceae bacterium]
MSFAAKISQAREIYLPIYQTNDYSLVFMVVRTNLSSAACASAIREALRPIQRTISTNEFRTLQELVDRAASPRRFLMLLLAGFSAFSMILAALGIYAVISFSVSRRTAELGIRMALGASAREIKQQIMVQALIPAGLGILIGIAAALVLGQSLTTLLFDVRPTDGATFLGMTIFLAAVASLAGYLPALRASRIDPINALRSN